MERFLLTFKIIIIPFLFCLSCSAQIKNTAFISELFGEVAEDEKIVAACQQKRREFQIAHFGKILPKISGHCFDGCPTSIVLPSYPREAKRLRISGQVTVETVVDENGKVVYAKVLRGNGFLKQAVLQAAYRSTYTPKKTCDNKPIKFRWTINCNFY